MLGKDVTENHPMKSDAWENADTLDLPPPRKTVIHEGLGWGILDPKTVTKSWW